ncbi:hypothetical protein ACFLW0_01335 [Chloroflexota bacterium]
MKETIREMTPKQLVASMFNGATSPVTEEEYKLLGISKFNMFKRKKFRDVYRSLMLYLIKRAIPGAFPEHASIILETYDEFFQVVCKDYPQATRKLEERLLKFEELVESEKEQPFLNLSLYISEMFEDRPKKLTYAAKLNNRIETLFSTLLTLGKEIKIKEK